MISAGELRESVVVESPTETPNDFGEVTVTWAAFASRRAAIRGMRVDELMNAQGAYTVATHEVVMRYLPGLTTAMRLRWNSRSPARTLDILSVAEEGNRESHRIVCKEQVA